jgi:hypothetical protein
LLRIKQGYKPSATPIRSASAPDVPAPHFEVSEPEVDFSDVSPLVSESEVAKSQAVEPQTNEISIAPLEVTKEDIAPHSRPNHYWTWQLLSSGYSAEECQAIRRISEESLFDHLLRAAREGLKVDPRWTLTSEQWQQLTALFGDAPPAEIQPLLSQLPEGLRYRDVQFYLLTREVTP